MNNGQSEPAISVVYLTGTGHSGSTLTAFLMDSHPEIVSVGQTSVKPKIRRRGGDTRMACSCGSRIYDCQFWSAVFADVQSQGLALGPGTWTNDYRYDSPVLHRVLTRYVSSPLLSRLQESAGHWLPGHRSRLIRIDRVNLAFMRAALRAKSARVFFDTSKNQMRLRRFLSLSSLNVKVLHLVRDPRGLASSAKKRGFDPQQSAEHWRNTHETLLRLARTVPADRWMTLRYEDLSRDPREVLRVVYRFAGVTDLAGPTFLEPRQHHILGNAMRLADRLEVLVDDTWKQRLSQPEQEQVLSVAGQLSRQFGYA